METNNAITTTFQSPGGDLGFSHVEKPPASGGAIAVRFNPLAGIWVFLTELMRRRRERHCVHGFNPLAGIWVFLTEHDDVADGKTMRRGGFNPLAGIWVFLTVKSAPRRQKSCLRASFNPLAGIWVFLTEGVHMAKQRARTFVSIPWRGFGFFSPENARATHARRASRFQSPGGDLGFSHCGRWAVAHPIPAYGFNPLAGIWVFLTFSSTTFFLSLRFNPLAGIWVFLTYTRHFWLQEAIKPVSIPWRGFGFFSPERDINERIEHVAYQFQSPGGDLGFSHIVASIIIAIFVFLVFQSPGGDLGFSHLSKIKDDLATIFKAFQSPGGDLGFSHSTSIWRKAVNLYGNVSIPWRGFGFFSPDRFFGVLRAARRFNPLAGIWVFLTRVERRLDRVVHVTPVSIPWRGFGFFSLKPFFRRFFSGFGGFNPLAGIWVFLTQVGS